MTEMECEITIKARGACEERQLVVSIEAATPDDVAAKLRETASVIEDGLGAALGSAEAV